MSEARISALEQRVAALEQRLYAVESRHTESAPERFILTKRLRDLRFGQTIIVPVVGGNWKKARTVANHLAVEGVRIKAVQSSCGGKAIYVCFDASKL